MFSRYLHDIIIAIEALKTNKLKSSLTALGILFGVAAVISMLAIGHGAKKEILKQIETIGANNIVIEANIDSGEKEEENNEEEPSGNGEKQQKRFSPGLNRLDYEAIKGIVPTIIQISPEIIIESQILHEGRSIQGKGVGISNDYLDIYNLELQRGTFFSGKQADKGMPVCILGQEIASRLFSKAQPIGEYVKMGHVWLKVIGVLKPQALGNISAEKYGMNDHNNSVYLPQKTMVLRYVNREYITRKPQSGGNYRVIIGGNFSSSSGRSDGNYHQYDRIILKVDETDHLAETAELLERMLVRRHNGIHDFRIIVPEHLLSQKQQAKEIFNFVLGAIAGISLLVGGIGIMNIMFATVMERIREIGIRMAIGAKKEDILVQFLTEAILISLVGGILGILLGVLMAGTIEKLADIETSVSLVSVLVAFLVSVSVGVIFGYSPARKAARKDPIESLRHE